MPVSDSYLEFVLEQFGSFAEVTSKRMFGGVGLYSADLFFGLIANNTLYFKVDESNRTDFERAGAEPFRPYGDNSYAMAYYEVPADVLDNPEKLRQWFDKAVRVASTSKRKPRNPRKKVRSRK